MIFIKKILSNIHNLIISKFYIGFPIAVFIWLSSFLWHWQIDDAGIVFSYSKNIASGFGIVAQPNLFPVEGCTNFLWILVFVPFFWIGLFSPIITSKIISTILTVITFYFISKIAEKEKVNQPTNIALLLFITTSCSLIIWLTGGLENPLYLLLITYLSYKIGISSETDNTSWGKNILIASVAFLIFLSRPDGLIFGIAYPVSLIVIYYLRNFNSKKLLYINLLKYSIVYFSSVTLFEIFRKFYFGEWVPNTFFAKVDSGSDNIINVLTFNEASQLKFFNLVNSITIGDKPLIYLILIIILPIILHFKQKLTIQT